MRRELFIGLFLTVATLVVFWQVLDHDFVGYDDAEYVTENHHVQAGLTEEGLIWAFTTTHASNWHPLTWLSHMLDCQLYGLNPKGHHLTNVFLHLLNTLLLFLVLQRMTGALWRSGFIAALFALHPLHVESVAWVAERKDVLSTFFWMLTLWSYARYVERPKPIRYLLTLLAFALGLIAKPMVVTLPFVLLLLDYWPLRRIKSFQLTRSDRAVTTRPSELNPQTLRLIWEKIPFFLLAAASSTVTFLVQVRGGAVASLEVFPFETRFANALVSYVRYMGKMFWPQDLAVLYPHPGHTLPLWQIAGAGSLLFLITCVVLRAGRRFPYLAVGWLWYLGTLVPVIGLVQVGVQAMADRYTYIPLIGLFIMIAWGVSDIAAKWRYQKVVCTLASGALLFVLIICTFIQLHHWQDATTLFEHALEVTTDNFVAHNNLGIALAAQGKFDEAIVHYSEALRIKPSYAKAHCNLGDVLARLGKHEDAIWHYHRALQLKPNFAEAHNNLGVTLKQQGRLNEAFVHYSRAIQLNPEYEEAHNNLAGLLAARGKLDEAIAHYSKALQIKPDYGNARVQLAVALMRTGQTDKAIQQYRTALHFRPDWPEVLNNLAWIFATHKDPRYRDGAKALLLAKKACELTAYKQANFLDTLAAAYAEANQFDQAVFTAQKAKQMALASGQEEIAKVIERQMQVFKTGKRSYEVSADRKL
jgi:Flp pilus assembly protein TadD